MIHALKTEKKFFEDVYSRRKKFEVRRHDRDFRVGDLLALNELNEERNGYTGRCLLLEITDILDDERFCKEGYVIISFDEAEISIGDGFCQGTYFLIDTEESRR